MLETQKFLIEHGIDELKSQYKIDVHIHEDGRMILNYSIFSPPYHPITSECRGLTLHKDDFSLISCPFFRFFNLGQNNAEKDIDWKTVTYQEKNDGTMLHVFFYKDEWRIQTRGSFGDTPFHNTELSPIDLVHSTCPGMFDYLNKQYTYIFELCTPHNKVIKEYKQPVLFLLTMFKGIEELSLARTAFYYSFLEKVPNLLLPETKEFQHVEEVLEFLIYNSIENPEFEGFVVRDQHNKRLKIKSISYSDLHAIGSNKVCLFHPKYLLPYILEDKKEKILKHFPEVGETLAEMEDVLTREFVEFQSSYKKLRKIFFESLPKTLKTKSIMIKLFNQNIKQVWKDSQKELYESIFEKNIWKDVKGENVDNS